MRGQPLDEIDKKTQEFNSGTLYESTDNWRHRSKRMKCQSCMWFVRKQTERPYPPEQTLGRCRRHAPTMFGFPAVFETDWCGDHKLDENKV